MLYFQRYHLKENSGNHLFVYFLILYRLGHNQRQDSVTFLQTPSIQRDWKNVKIMIFDTPQATDKPYSQRLEMIQQST
jgi:hypothetical protein